MAHARVTITDRLLTRIFHRLPLRQQTLIANLLEKRQEEIAYHRVRDKGFRPGGFIDVGAYHGNWSRMANDVFGAAPTLMVEAQPALLDHIKAAAAELEDARIASCLLGETAGEEVIFYEMGTGSSMLPETSDVPRTERRLMTRTLDDLVAESLPGVSSLFLKIDVQGAELKVLRGGLDTLKRAEMVQLELAMLQYNAGAPLLPEVVAFMAAQGFLPFEISGFSRMRGHLVQVDFLFAREGSVLRPDRFVFQD